MNGLRDGFSRVIDYLRISVTDKCNLRCVYCMPEAGVAPVRHGDVLSYEEIIRVTAIAASLGVRKVRITGGEPLVRRNLPFLIASIRELPGIEDISLTTNGVLLADMAVPLAHAGLDRVNISIDSFRPERYRTMTRGGELTAVLRGLQAAHDSGLFPVKINMVPVRGLNEDEIPAFGRMTLTSDYHVRFIECMPTGSLSFWSPQRYMTTDEIKSSLSVLGRLSPVRQRKHGPSKYFRLAGASGVIGFISALSHHFCGDCNRLRLTADGKLRPCLFSETEIDLRSPVRSGASDAEIERLLRLAVAVKPKEHALSDTSPDGRPADPPTPDGKSFAGRRPMSRIGG